MVKPFLNWAGGKQKLAATLADLAPKSWNTYWEPFLGGGSLFFYVPEGVAILSDINDSLVDAYRAVRDYPFDLLQELEKHRRKHTRDYYYRVRKKIPSVLVVEEAARFIYLNKMCFNGLYRVNKKGEFNVPLGNRSPKLIYEPEELLQASNKLQDAELRIQDFRDIIPEEGDFIYCDPPYSGAYKMYTPDQFSENDHRGLRESALVWHSRGSYVMISEKNIDFIRELYSTEPFVIHDLNSKTTISGADKGRKNVEELVVTNYETPT